VVFGDVDAAVAEPVAQGALGVVEFVEVAQEIFGSGGELLVQVAADLAGFGVAGGVHIEEAAADGSPSQGGEEHEQEVDDQHDRKADERGVEVPPSVAPDEIIEQSSSRSFPKGSMFAAVVVGEIAAKVA